MNTQEGYQIQINRFTQWLEKHELQHLNPLLPQGEVDLDKLLGLCVVQDTTNKLSLHATWFLEKYALAHPDQLISIVNFLLMHLAEVRIEGAQRIIGNIFMQALKHSSPWIPTADQDEALINCGFDWLTSPATPIATIANSFDLLYTLSLRHEWIREALAAEINLILERGTTPAIQSRGQKILKQLSRKPQKK